MIYVNGWNKGWENFSFCTIEMLRLNDIVMNGEIFPTHFHFMFCYEKLLISDWVFSNSDWDFPTQNIFFRPFSQHDVKTEKIHLKNHAMHELNLVLCLLTRILSVSSGQFSWSLSTKQFNLSSKEWRCLTRISFHSMFSVHRWTSESWESVNDKAKSFNLTMSTWEF